MASTGMTMAFCVLYKGALISCIYSFTKPGTEKTAMNQSKFQKLRTTTRPTVLVTIMLRRNQLFYLCPLVRFTVMLQAAVWLLLLSALITPLLQDNVPTKWKIYHGTGNQPSISLKERHYWTIWTLVLYANYIDIKTVIHPRQKRSLIQGLKA